MKTSELRKLIREEARKVIATSKNKSTKVNEGIFDTMMKALSQKVKLDGTILAKPEAKKPIADLDKAAKGKPETLTAFTKMAKQMGVDLVKNMEKVKEAVVYAFIKGKFNNWIAGSFTGVYDPKTFEFSLVPSGLGQNALTSESQDSMQVALKRTIREGTPKFKVGQEVDDLNGDEPFKIVKMYPNKAAAMMDMKKTISPKLYKDLVDEVEEMYSNYRAIGSKDDNKPWYILKPTERAEDKGYPPFLNPEAYVFLP